jgi:hypothetical protein
MNNLATITQDLAPTAIARFACKLEGDGLRRIVGAATVNHFRTKSPRPIRLVILWQLFKELYSQIPPKLVFSNIRGIGLAIQYIEQQEVNRKQTPWKKPEPPQLALQF